MQLIEKRKERTFLKAKTSNVKRNYGIGREDKEIEGGNGTSREKYCTVGIAVVNRAIEDTERSR